MPISLLRRSITRVNYISLPECKFETPIAGAQLDNVFRLKYGRYRFLFEKNCKEVTWSEVINEKPVLKKIKKGKIKIKIMFWKKVLDISS